VKSVVAPDWEAPVSNYLHRSLWCSIVKVVLCEFVTHPAQRSFAYNATWGMAENHFGDSSSV